MKKLIALVLLALGLVAYFTISRAPEPAAGAAPDPASAAAVIAEQVRVRSEARARGEIDVSPCSAAGRILDESSGRGIADALVQLRPYGLERVTVEDAGAPRTAVSDVDGAWSISHLPAGRHVLTASAPAYLPGERRDLSLRAGQDNPGHDLTLARGGHPLRGSVVDVGGGPVEGAVVLVEGVSDGNMIDFSRVSWPALSDADGRFVVQVHDGPYTVSAWHPDYSDEVETVDVAGGPRSVELRLVPAASVEGVVRAVSDGSPVADALVSDGEFAGLDGDAVRSDAAGRFRLSRLGPGVHALSVVAAGHASGEPVKVELGIGEALTGVELRVERAYKISGFVVPRGETQRSLESVMVAAYSLSPMQVRVASEPSGADGYFEVLGVRPGSYILGSVAEQALPELVGPSVTVEAADVTGIVLTLDRGVEIHGRVDPPVPASVTLALDEDSNPLAMLGNAGNLFVRARADARGEFVLRPVKPGRMRVIAEAPDGARGELALEVGDRGEAGVLVALEPRASATGRIVDASGAPLRSGSVEYQPRKRPDKQAFTLRFDTRVDNSAAIAEDGSYTLRGLDGGAYEVRVLDRAGNVVRWADTGDRRYRPAQTKLAAGVATTGLDFSVEQRDGVLRGVVVDERGAALPDAWVTVAPVAGDEAESRFYRPKDEAPAERVGVVPDLPKEPGTSKADGDDAAAIRGEPVLSGEDGRFEVRGLARRPHRVQAEALRGSARARLEDVAVDGEVRLQVAPLAAIAGSVRAGGVPVPKFDLMVERLHKGGSVRSPQSVQRADGGFELDHQDPGSYRITITADQGRVVHELELAAGQQLRLSLELQPWARLRGTVVDGRTGAPLAGVSLSIRESFAVGAAFDMLLGKGPRTDAAGRFELPRVAAGDGTLNLFEGDLMDRSTVAEVKYVAEAGVVQDLGTIRGVTTAKVPKAERGELGLRFLVATAARRPRPPGSEVSPLERKEEDATPRHLYVLAVTIDGAADRAGLQPGDELLAIDGQSVASVGPDNARRLLAAGAVRSGQSLALEIERDGGQQTLTVEATASKRPGK